MQKRMYLISLVAVIIISLFLAFWELDKVDIEGSEDIYVADSVSYLRHDPFIAARHHLRKPHFPASPHPFLVQMMTYVVFKYMGLSIFSSRFLQAISYVVTTVLLMFMSYKLFKSWTVSVLAGFVYSTLPLVVRFSRMAIIDPLLSLWVITGMIMSWSLIKAKSRLLYFFSGLCGIIFGLSISTKLTGIFFALPYFCIFIWRYFYTRDKVYIKAFIVFLIFSLGIFTIFNDPYSYYFGWTHFEGRRVTNVSISNMILGIIHFPYWYQFGISLLGIIPAILLLYGIIHYRKWWENEKRIFILFWIFGPASYLIINPPHKTGLSAEWSYLPLFVPLSIILGKIATDIWKSKAPGYLKQNIGFLLVIYGVFNSMFLVFYGLRFKQMPLATYLHARNVVRYDLAVTKTIDRLNLEDRKILVFVNLVSVGFPLWLLKDSVTTEPQYHPLEAYDYVVTDREELIKKVKDTGFIVVSNEKNPTEREVLLFRNLRE